MFEDVKGFLGTTVPKEYIKTIKKAMNADGITVTSVAVDPNSNKAIVLGVEMKEIVEDKKTKNKE